MSDIAKELAEKIIHAQRQYAGGQFYSMLAPIIRETLIAAAEQAAQEYQATMQRQNKELLALQEDYKHECDRSAALLQELIDLKRDCDPSGQYPKLRAAIAEKDAELAQFRRQIERMSDLNDAVQRCERLMLELKEKDEEVERWKEKFFHEEEMGDNLRKERGELQDELAQLRALCGNLQYALNCEARLIMAQRDGNCIEAAEMRLARDNWRRKFDAAAKGEL